MHLYIFNGTYVANISFRTSASNVSRDTSPYLATHHDPIADPVLVHGDAGLVGGSVFCLCSRIVYERDHLLVDILVSYALSSLLLVHLRSPSSLKVLLQKLSDDSCPPSQQKRWATKDRGFDVYVSPLAAGDGSSGYHGIRVCVLGENPPPLGLLGYKLRVRGCRDPVAQNRDKTHVLSETKREEARLRAKYRPCCRDWLQPGRKGGPSLSFIFTWAMTVLLT